MGRIRVLGDHTIDRIAAGEVVERPASVVKELVENSLDAGSLTVRIRLEGGGKRFIQVQDDGEGMDRDDALLALERHATSKLESTEDLLGIRTLGFRGEALPSIAAVSRFTLRTCTEGGAGTEIEVRGGKILAVREAGLPRGTTVEVDRLFFNVPARRKFLRADATELSHIVRFVTRQALARPGTRFVLEHGDRELLNASRTQSLEDRATQVLGPAQAKKLVPFDLRKDLLRIHGFAGRPVDAVRRRVGQHLFVNGRIVQDRILAHAVSHAYGNTVAPGLHPSLILFVEMEPGMLDVNVHPQKTEVRFHLSGEVHDAVAEAIRSTLSEGAAVPCYGDLRPRSLASRGRPLHDAATPYLAMRDRGRDGEERLKETGGSTMPAAVGETGPAGASTVPEGPLHAAVALAQYGDSYIVAGDDEGLVIVDQHAAHERVLFERFLAEAERNEVEVQRLMFPLTVELSPEERIVFEQEAEEFRRLGFLVEPFGGNSVRLDGVPALVGETDPEALLHEILGEAAKVKSAVSASESLRYRLVTTAACKAAVKIHHPLNIRGMQRLLDDLYGTVSPTTCPHGRPLLFRLTLDEIERAFRRK